MKNKFNPSLITELFEGWIYDDWICCYREPNLGHLISFKDDTIFILNGETEAYVSLPTPKSSEDFITFCCYVDIELEYRTV